MAGFENNVMLAKNVNFDPEAAKPHLGIINAAGKILIGTGNVQPSPEILAGSLTSSTLTIAYASPNITINTKGGGIPIEQLTVDGGDTLTPSGTPENITITGLTVANGTHAKPVFLLKTGASTATVDVQVGSAIAATDITKSGLAAFNSAHFSVDASGFVSLAGGGEAIDSVAMQTGTSPVVPTVAGLWTLNGATVAAGTNPIRTNGTGANTSALEVQISQAIAATDATKIGLSNFNSAHFSVDANGFVGLAGGGQAVDSIAVQTGTSPIVPTAAGLVTINGAVVAAGTNPVRTDGTDANTMALEVQTSQALAAADATKIGLSNFDSAYFTVSATGFVSAASTGFIKTLTGNSGGAISPTSNNINTLGTGSITIAGAGSTLTTQLTGLTNHAVLVGAGTATITNVGPTSTAGQVLQSAGAAADPAFSTATYPATTTVSQILYSSSTNTVTGLATANRAVLTTGSTGVPVLTALATDGQLIIGSTAGAPAAATLTAGTGISITNASNSITVAVSGSAVGETITGDTGGALSPTAGNWNIVGNSPAAGTNPVQTTGSGSTLTVKVQKSQAISATDATKIGLSNFDSASFGVDANGFVTVAAFPAFSAYLSGGVTNVTGAGTTYTIGSTGTLTEVFDVTSNFNSANGTFTAPVTGKYQFNYGCSVTGLTSLMTFGRLNIATSNRSYELVNANFGIVRTVATVADQLRLSFSILADMDAADTTTFTIIVSGGASDSADIEASSAYVTGMSGYLVQRG